MNPYKRLLRIVVPLGFWLSRKALARDGWRNEGEGRWSKSRWDGEHHVTSTYFERQAVDIMMGGVE